MLTFAQPINDLVSERRRQRLTSNVSTILSDAPASQDSVSDSDSCVFVQTTVNSGRNNLNAEQAHIRERQDVRELLH